MLMYSVIAHNSISSKGGGPGAPRGRHHHRLLTEAVDYNFAKKWRKRTARVEAGPARLYHADAGSARESFKEPGSTRGYDSAHQGPSPDGERRARHYMASHRQANRETDDYDWVGYYLI